MHWIRANWQSIERASARASAVLPTPGIVLDEHVSLGQQGDDQVVERLAAGPVPRCATLAASRRADRGGRLRLLRR